MKDWHSVLRQQADLARLKLQQHRRAVTAAVAALFTGAAATAFGIAPLAPDAADLPQRDIVETVRPDSDVAAQIEALAAHRLELHRADLTRRGDTPETLLRRLDVVDSSAAQFLRTDRTARRILEGRPEKMVRAKVDSLGRLLELTVRFPADTREQVATHFTRVTVRADEQGRWSATSDIAPLQSSVRFGSGSIRSTLFAATDEAQIPDPVASQMAELFAGDIDFHRELKKGDTFSIVYESLLADGEPINWNQSAGRILAAEFVNNGRTHQAVWFSENGRGGYYDLSGRSKRRAFLASPMAFSRVTSGFAMRFHPVHQEMRAHLGVDYGAPVGTPARTVGDGVVEQAGWGGGYGNMVVVRHSPDKTTLYAHLSKIEVKRGERVTQGQRIGLVGATGTATGPHLHFEFRINGRHVDPLKIARQAEALPLADSSRAPFMATVEQLQVKLAVAGSLVGTSDRGD